MNRWAKPACYTMGIAVAAIGGWLATGLLDGPWGMIPGGPFSEESEPCTTAEWGTYARVREVAVEVWPPTPRSVTTWTVVYEGELFLPADFLTPWKRWPHQVMEDDRVRVRVEGSVFACRAERVEDKEAIRELRLIAARKYDLDPQGMAAQTEVWWFRVRPR